MIQLAERMNRLGTETAFEVLAKAKALEAKGRHIIHLEIGEPDFDTPAHIVAGAVAALRSGQTRYTPTCGILPLRQAIARWTSQYTGCDVRPEQVVVTPGAKPILFFAILALLGHGDEAIYPDPGFPIYKSVIDFVGAKAVALPLREKQHFRFDPDEFLSLVTERTRLIILNSPQNPTGGILTGQEMALIAEVAKERNLVVLSDEIYDQILYEGEHVSMLSLPGMAERTILLNGFSKTYAMTGWRLGYGIMPPPLAEQVTRIMVNANSCTAAFTQYAGITALEGPREDIRKMVAAFKERRDVIVAGLNNLPGFRCASPAGAFYAFPHVQGTGMSSQALADRLLVQGGVAVLDGSCFGRQGTGYLRFSYANSVANIQEALERIRQVLE